MDSYSSSHVDFLTNGFVVSGKTCRLDGQQLETVDPHNHALGGNWSSAEHASKTSARFLHAMVVLPDGVVMLHGIGEHMAKKCNVI